jgi:hypothetical protein
MTYIYVIRRQRVIDVKTPSKYIYIYKRDLGSVAESRHFQGMFGENKEHVGMKFCEGSHFLIKQIHFDLSFL